MNKKRTIVSFFGSIGELLGERELLCVTAKLLDYVINFFTELSLFPVRFYVRFW